MSNKWMILGSLAALAVWGGAHMFGARKNLAEAAAIQTKAEAERVKWLKFFDKKDGLQPKPAAEQAVKNSNERLNQQLVELQKLEFAMPKALEKFSLKAAGSGDIGNYLLKRRDEIKTAAADTYHVKLAEDKRKQADTKEGIALNLLRLAFVESLLAACKTAGVGEIKSLTYETPATISDGTEVEKSEKRETRGSRGKPEKEAPKKDPALLLVQFPLKATFVAPERVFGQLLFELQKPTEGAQGHFNVRSFSIDLGDAQAARHAKDGNILATVVLVPMLSVKTTQEIGLDLKSLEEEAAPRPDAPAESSGGLDRPE
jgi:hypothetical protein